MLCMPSVLNMTSSDSQIDKPQRGRPKRAELPDVNINTGAQSINTEKSLFNPFIAKPRKLLNPELSNET